MTVHVELADDLILPEHGGRLVAWVRRGEARPFPLPWPYATVLSWARPGRRLDDWEFDHLRFRRRLAHLSRAGLIRCRRGESATPRWAAIARNVECPELYFAFAGEQGGLMGPAHEFLEGTGLTDANTVIFRDSSQRYYSGGISRECPSMPALIAWMRGYQRALGIRPENTHLIGVSRGAFAALLCGHYLAPGTVTALAPERLSYRPGWTGQDGLEWDLRRLLGRHNGFTEYRVYFNSAFPDDARVAGSLAKCPGVRLHPQPGRGHNVLAPLVDSGALASLLPRSEPGTSNAPAAGPPLLAREDWRAELEGFLGSLRAEGWSREELSGPLDLDSLEIVQLAAFVQSRLRVRLPPFRLQELVAGSLDDLLAALTAESDSSVSTHPARDSLAKTPAVVARSTRFDEGAEPYLETNMEIGMPLLGENNLAEVPLIKLAGDLQWQLTSRITGVPSRDIVDSDGERLYATFFFVELSFPPATPMAAFVENAPLHVRSLLRRYGTSTLDGYHLLRSHPDAAPDPWNPEDWPLRVPYLRMSNAFVRQWKGAQWLKKSEPASERFLDIPALDSPPDSFDTLRRAKETGRLLRPGTDFVPLGTAPTTTELPIVPERGDVNGAGLLYFAHYPLFLDMAERESLSSSEGLLRLDPKCFGSRTVLHRRSAYFSNAEKTDTLCVETEAWLQVPTDLAPEDRAQVPVEMLFNHKMTRESDGRLMMISGVRKLFERVTLGELDLVDPPSNLPKP